MFLLVDAVLSSAEAEVICKASETLAFADGKATAGRFAQEVKANDQALASDELAAIEAMVAAKLSTNGLFQSAARPKKMTKLILSRYRLGQTYGLHVDDALMGGIRTDLSFTLFLSAPDTYDGGALIVEDMTEARAFKPAAGDLMLYPSTTLHRVEPITRGTRLAMVGWVQSWIRSADQREILFDLDRSIEEIYAKEGKSGLFDTLAKTRSNLLRQWAGV